MKCYHMTKLDYLDSINQFGLLPRSGDNSRLIQDDQVKVFFSEGYEGAIALYVDFSIVYRKAKEKERSDGLQVCSGLPMWEFNHLDSGYITGQKFRNWERRNSSKSIKEINSDSS